MSLASILFLCLALLSIPWAVLKLVLWVCEKERVENDKNNNQLS